MKKILWISRHFMSTEQEKDLERIYGEISITQLDKTITDVNLLEEEIEKFDIFAVVLPITKISELKEITNGKPVIQAISKRILDSNAKEENQETKYTFVHDYWEEVEEVKIKVKRL